MKIHKLTLIILEINSLVDEGNYGFITISDIHKAIHSEKLLAYIKDVCKENVDFSYLEDEDIKVYEEKMLNIYEAYAGDEYRKWGVKKNGLCLVIAWTNEIIQQNASIKFR
jgi:hypothetical protein|tara:strand:+ start:24223 stop:24555 length:333 start_codon:yes stop_codon:yes gene_type:complete